MTHTYMYNLSLTTHVRVITSCMPVQHGAGSRKPLHDPLFEKGFRISIVIKFWSTNKIQFVTPIIFPSTMYKATHYTCTSKHLTMDKEGGLVHTGIVHCTLTSQNTNSCHNVDCDVGDPYHSVFVGVTFSVFALRR